MQLTTERLKQIIKEELAEITNQLVADEEQEEVSEVDAEIASLEQQLAEAKKKVEMAKGKKAAMKGDKMPAKRGDAGMKKVGPEQTFSSAKSAMKTMKKGK